MGRHKKNKSIESKEKQEVIMTVETEDKINTLETLETEIDRTRAELEKVKVELEEKKALSKSMTLREVDEEEMVIVRKQQNMTNEMKSAKEKIEKQKAYDNVKVTGKFINRFKPGQAEKLLYQKYDSDPVKWYTFEDGQVYTIPRGFADQINGGTENDPMYYKPRFVEKQGHQEPSDRVGENSSIGRIETWDKKYSFVPTQF